MYNMPSETLRRAREGIEGLSGTLPLTRHKIIGKGVDMPRVEIDIKAIEAELKDFSGNHVTVRRHSGAMCSVRETDKLVSIHINPKKVRTQANLDLVMHHCRGSLGGID